MIKQTLSIEGPNVVARKWMIDDTKPKVQVIGYQYQFNSELINTVQIQSKHIAAEMLK